MHLAICSKSIMWCNYRIRFGSLAVP